MATIVISNTNSPTALKVKLTYTAGNGKITVTKIEGYRTDGYTTADYASQTCNLKIGSSTKTFTCKPTFNANSSSTTLYSGSLSQSGLSGNTTVSVSFPNTSVSNIKNASLSTTINAGYSYATIVWKNNSSTANTSSARWTLGTNTIYYTLTGTNGNATVQYYANGAWKTFITKTADGTYNNTATSTFVNDVLTSFTNTGQPNVRTRVVNSAGNGPETTLYVQITNTLPTLGSISLTADNTTVTNTRTKAYPELGSLFVKGLTIPKVTFNNASGISGSTISSYYIKDFTGYSQKDFVLSMSGSTSLPTNFAPLTTSGTNTINAYVKDSRGFNSASKQTTINVIDYGTPFVTFNAKRCLQNGTLNEDGEYANLEINYKIYPINDGTKNINTKKMECQVDYGDWEEITVSDYEGTIYKVVGNGVISVNATHTIAVRVTDISTTSESYQQIAPSKKLISRFHSDEGEGVTLGRVATEIGFHDYLGTTFHNGVKYEGIDMSPANHVLLTTSSQMNASETLTFNGKVSEQKNGIVLVWSGFANGKEQDYQWHFDFIPKQWVSLKNGNGVTCIMSGAKLAPLCSKYVYITDTTIRGHADNEFSGDNPGGITLRNNQYVLRYVIGV